MTTYPVFTRNALSGNTAADGAPQDMQQNKLAMNTTVVPGYPDSPQPIPEWMRNLRQHREGIDDPSQGYDMFSAREPRVRDQMQRWFQYLDEQSRPYPGYPAYQKP